MKKHNAKYICIYMSFLKGSNFMARVSAMLFIHISKFDQEKLATQILHLKNWYENQNRFKQVILSFPTFLWQELKKEEILYFWLTRMIKEKFILYFPNTYSGENHQSLSEEEIALDLKYCLSNSEKTGYQDLFEELPSGIFISNKDLYRNSIQRIYQTYRNILLIEGIREEKGQKFILYSQKSNKAYIKIYSANLKEKCLLFFRSIIPLWQQQRLLFLSSQENTSLEKFINSIPSFLFKERPIFYKGKRSNLYWQTRKPILAESSLEILSHNITRQEKALKSDSIEIIKKNLTSIYSSDLSINISPKGEAQQVLEGEISLNSDDFILNFKKGVLINWVNKKKNLPLLPKSHNATLGKKLKESDHHSLSLEQGYLRGIRQVLFASGTISSYLDYLSLEEIQGFLINAFFTWNSSCLNNGSKLILFPFELPLFKIEKNKGIKISVFNSKKEVFEKFFIDEESYEILWGESFFFHHEASPLMITFLQEKDIINFPLMLYVKRVKKDFYLFLNIGGTNNYTKIEENFNYYQTFSFIIEQTSHFPFSPPSYSYKVLKESLPFKVWKEKKETI